jgi:ribosomal protein S27AE
MQPQNSGNSRQSGAPRQTYNFSGELRQTNNFSNEPRQMNNFTGPSRQMNNFASDPRQVNNFSNGPRQTNTSQGGAQPSFGFNTRPAAYSNSPNCSSLSNTGAQRQILPDRGLQLTPNDPRQVPPMVQNNPRPPVEPHQGQARQPMDWVNLKGVCSLLSFYDGWFADMIQRDSKGRGHRTAAQKNVRRKRTCTRCGIGGKMFHHWDVCKLKCQVSHLYHYIYIVF